MVGYQAAIASKLAPTGFDVRLQETGWLTGQLPQGSVYTCKRLVGWQVAIAGRPAFHRGPVFTCKRMVGYQAAIAGKPAPTGFGVHLQEIGRLACRHRRQASSHRGSVFTCK
ncbi:hypothetical protein [Pseudomonas sp. DR48]|uniref:hypothetical protein n=1 Tax=Pseudomonas sp. DR48 TaxID=2871095 RepID=UPI001C99AA15|nr:hypothetical protein [Pseudomonas sp. DR48]QZP33271.1 hypothetical protein K5K95_02335 [Pseudomonas sp. DR48]